MWEYVSVSPSDSLSAPKASLWLDSREQLGLEDMGWRVRKSKIF